jgi:hypothetical protein
MHKITVVENFAKFNRKKSAFRAVLARISFYEIEKSARRHISSAVLVLYHLLSFTSAAQAYYSLFNTFSAQPASSLNFNHAN